MHARTAARPDRHRHRARPWSDALLAPTAEDRGARRWVVAELDSRGEIDDHAAMCLRQAIKGACAHAATTIVVDLRDLTAIDAAGLRMFVQATARCRASGVQLALLICGDARHDAIVGAFNAAGLVDQLQYTYQPPRIVIPFAPRWMPGVARRPLR